ncbi:MAG: DUF2807 domain-containing protein [Bacteroidaceae bacterium]|nr:DUF2807 domain-containing protein [Bacteroidaceae bacterium]
MNIKTILTGLCLAATLSMSTSCDFSPENMNIMARKGAGKDYFRDSEKWGKVITQTIESDDFTHIALSGNADIHIHQGIFSTLEIQGNERAIAGNNIQVKDGTLTVAKKDSISGTLPSIKLIVTVPTLESIHVSGAGDIEMKDTLVFDNNLTLNISGAGDIDIDRLKCKNFALNISGAGDVKAQKIKCKTATLQISGAGDVKADLKGDNIDVAISGAGDADLDVKCDQLTVAASGTGEVELSGECRHMTKRVSGMSGIDSKELTIHEGISLQ